MTKNVRTITLFVVIATTVGGCSSGTSTPVAASIPPNGVGGSVDQLYSANSPAEIRTMADHIAIATVTRISEPVVNEEFPGEKKFFTSQATLQVDEPLWSRPKSQAMRQSLPKTWTTNIVLTRKGHKLVPWTVGHEWIVGRRYLIAFIVREHEWSPVAAEAVFALDSKGSVISAPNPRDLQLKAGGMRYSDLVDLIGNTKPLVDDAAFPDDPDERMQRMISRARALALASPTVST